GARLPLPGPGDGLALPRPRRAPWLRLRRPDGAARLPARALPLRGLAEQPAPVHGAAVRQLRQQGVPVRPPAPPVPEPAPRLPAGQRFPRPKGRWHRPSGPAATRQLSHEVPDSWASPLRFTSSQSAHGNAIGASWNRIFLTNQSVTTQ